MKNNNLTYAITFIVVVILAVVLILSLSSKGSENKADRARDNLTNKEIIPEKTVRTDDGNEISSPAITEADHIRGNIDAPITIVEFADLECPFCKRFHQTMQQVIWNSKNI